MPMTPESALVLARELHGDAVDKLGEDYVDGHLTRVQRNVRQRGGDSITEIAAALHDAVEDTPATPESLAAVGVPAAAIALIAAVTRTSGEDYGVFIESVARHPDRRAIVLKLADLADNADGTRNERLARLNPEKARRYAERYATAIDRLTSALAERDA